MDDKKASDFAPLDNEFGWTALSLFERLVTAMEKIADSLQPKEQEFVELEPDRNDQVDPEIIATLEMLEAEGQEVPDVVYEKWGLEPPDRSKPKMDDSVFDLPQALLAAERRRNKAMTEPSEPPEPEEPEEPDVISLKGDFGGEDGG